MYSWAGFGLLDLSDLEPGGGVVEASSSHYASAWQAELGTPDGPVDLFTRGWLAGAVALVQAMAAAVNAIGWGRWQVTDVDSTSANVVLNDEYESVGHPAMYGPSDHPVSHLAEGAVLGIMNLVCRGKIVDGPTSRWSSTARCSRAATATPRCARPVGPWGRDHHLQRPRADPRCRSKPASWRTAPGNPRIAYRLPVGVDVAHLMASGADRVAVNRFSTSVAGARDHFVAGFHLGAPVRAEAVDGSHRLTVTYGPLGGPARPEAVMAVERAIEQAIERTAGFGGPGR